MRFCLLTLACLLFSHLSAAAQEAVYLTNPSFEGNPQYGSVPGGWRNCALSNESSPDIHPVTNDIQLVRQQPQDGETYLGLMAHQNATVESIGQNLTAPLRSGQCYSMSIYLCKSNDLVFENYQTGGSTDYTNPGVLRIWGGLSPCGQKTLLASSPRVENTDWVKYTFQFQPAEDLTWITFEIYYPNGTRTAYNCNLLMDNASPVIPIDCASKAPLIDLDSLKKPVYSFTKLAIPKNVKSYTFHSAYGGSFLLLDLRVVLKPEDIESIILDNCGETGFRFSRAELTDEIAIGLKEVAVNVERFKSKVLIVGIPNVGKRLVKRRIHRLKRIFREIGLPKKQYRIVTLPPGGPDDGWLCGQREIWLKLGQR